jgi:hypothetical protein
VKWWVIWLYESVLYEVYKIRHRKSDADMEHDWEELIDLIRRVLPVQPSAEDGGKQTREQESSA